MDDDSWDDRFAQAVRLRRQLAERGIWFAPIRHHSPACARGVRQMIHDVRPQAVLIEGPAEYDQLLPLLEDAATKPPIAILSVLPVGDGAISQFFPLADFSPEWVGLRTAAEMGTEVAFIDRPWTSTIDDTALAALASERYYAQSRALMTLAEAEHCRDHDELWEHLFELRDGTDWKALFDDVFAWSALARLDYEPEVLTAEGSLAREDVMASHIAAWRARTDGLIVVITGAFHTLALVETLSGSGQTVDRVLSRPINTPQANLIRYDLAQLNRQTGYGAGVPSPGFYQRQWDAPGDAAVEILSDVARLANAATTSDRMSVVDVIEASLQAHRLADLRGHSHPGRYDLLDACTSCFAQAPAIRDAITRVFGGARIGAVPPNTPAPPIVAEARREAQKLRLVIDDTMARDTSLDVRRSVTARRRSRFFWLMSYLQTGFARRTAGSDYVAGRGLSLMREDWNYAWTPMVEANLIGLISDGATLHEAAQHRLRAAECDTRSSMVVAQTVAQAALIGLDDEVARLQRRLDDMIEQDPELPSVLGAAQQVLGLWRARDFLDIAEPELLLDVVNRALPQVAYLIGKSANASAEDEPGVITAMISAHDLVRQQADLTSVNADVLRDALNRLRDDASPGVRGAALALGVASGDVPDEELTSAVRMVFGPGADMAAALRFFNGVMQAAPDLFLHTPELFDAVSGAVDALDPSAFLDALPELRASFAKLRPFETAQVAERVATRTGGPIVAQTLSISADDLRLGAAVEQALLVSLADDALGPGVLI